MPAHPLIDTHLHLWDPARLRYPWLDDSPKLNSPFLLEGYNAATAGCEVEAMVFVQCEAAPADCHAEAAWISKLAETDPRIAAIVAWAPLEKGAAVEVELERLAKFTHMRGIRRIIQYEDDPEFCLRPDFIAGVRKLKEFNWRFEICVDWQKLPAVITFADSIPDVPMVLNHIGKPPVASGKTEPWSKWIQALAHMPHISCKISGVATEADHNNWSPDQLKRYMDIAIDTFGFDRIFFGGDWPVSTPAIGYGTWVEIVDEVLGGTSKSVRDKFWRENAIRFYDLRL